MHVTRYNIFQPNLELKGSFWESWVVFTIDKKLVTNANCPLLKKNWANR